MGRVVVYKSPYEVETIKQFDNLVFKSKSNVNNIEETYYLKLNKVKKTLSELAKLNIDISKYSKLLDSIQSDFEEDKNDFQKYINKLDEILEELKKYDLLYIPYYASQSINCELIQKDIDKNKLDELVKLTLSLLSKINITNIDDYNNVKSIMEDIYSVVYQVMKLEFRFYSKSKIFDYVKNNEVMKEYMSSNIETDLERFNNTNVINNSIKKLISEIKSQGINYDYMNEALLVYLSMDDSYIRDLQSQLDILLDNIQNNNDNIEKLYNDIESCKDELKPYNKRISNNSLKALIFSFLVAVPMFTASKVQHSLAAKDFNTTFETYSSLNDENNTWNVYQNKYFSDKTSYKKIRPYVKNENGYEREVKEYDLTNIKYEDLLDFLNIDLDKSGIDSHTYTESKESLNPEDEYSEEYIEIENIDVDKKDYILASKGGYIFGKVIVNFLALLLFAMIYAFITYEFNIDTIDEIIASIIKDLKDTKIKRKDLIKLKELLIAEKKLLDNNEKLKNEFIKKYNMLFERENGLKLKK